MAEALWRSMRSRHTLRAPGDGVGCQSPQALPKNGPSQRRQCRVGEEHFQVEVFIFILFFFKLHSIAQTGQGLRGLTSAALSGHIVT